VFSLAALKAIGPQRLHRRRTENGDRKKLLAGSPDSVPDDIDPKRADARGGSEVSTLAPDYRRSAELPASRSREVGQPTSTAQSGWSARPHTF